MFSNKTQTAAEMLNEIKSETAAQLMSSVLYQTSPPGTTGLPGLDVQFLSGTTNRASSSSPLNRGDVIEIQGSAASGKTRLVYCLVVQCILPSRVSLSKETIPSEVEIGGWEKGAVIIDTDGRWSIKQLRILLLNRLEESLSVQTGSFELVVEDVITKCLQRLHVFRPKSSASLAATLFRLPAYLIKHSSDEEIALLAIDSISSFYWTDKYNFEQQHQGPSNRKERTTPLHLVLVALQEFRVRYGPVTLFTNWGLFPASKDPATDGSDTAPSPFYRQHLHPFPAPFETPSRVLPSAHTLPPITHHITLMPSATVQLPPEVCGFREAVELSRKRCAGFSKGTITGILRTVETSVVTTFTLEDFDKR